MLGLWKGEDATSWKTNPYEANSGHVCTTASGVLLHQDITDRLLDGAKQCLVEHDAAPESIDVFHVPGAWELPQAAAWVVAGAVRSPP